FPFYRLRHECQQIVYTVVRDPACHYRREALVSSLVTVLSTTNSILQYGQDIAFAATGRSHWPHSAVSTPDVLTMRARASVALHTPVFQSRTAESTALNLD